jgi:catalase
VNLNSNLAARLKAYALIAVIPAVLGAGAAFAAGWIGPRRVSGAEAADALEFNAGRQAGYRRAHAKGVCFTGWFEANGAGSELSRASAFVAGRYPVTGRFSLGGGDPMAGDGRNVFRSMAFAIRTPDGEEWRLAMDHTPIFPVATVKAFVAFQRASRPERATGRPDPERMRAYLADHPETAAFQAYMAQAPLPDSFANSTYYSVNAFRFTNKIVETRFVRWAMRPRAALSELNKETLDRLPPNFMYQEIERRLRKGPARWDMAVSIAAPGDIVDDATVPWPPERRQLDVGALVVERIAAEELQQADCRDLTFDPTILPPGISPSDDPILGARAAAYVSSLRRRAVEGAGPSAFGLTRLDAAGE